MVKHSEPHKIVSVQFVVTVHNPERFAADYTHSIQDEIKSNLESCGLVVDVQKRGTK